MMTTTTTTIVDELTETVDRETNGLLLSLPVVTSSSLKVPGILNLSLSHPNQTILASDRILITNQLILPTESEDKFPSVPSAEFPSPAKRPLTQTIENIIDYYEPFLNQAIDENGAYSFLSHSRWPIGFQEEYIASCKEFAFRFLLIDNSGSMMVGDGHKVVGRGRRSKLMPCTRWVELLDFLNFQARLANASKVPTEFRFLRQSQSTVVGGREDNGTGLQDTLKLLGDMPQGSVGLCAQMKDLINTITTLQPILQQQNRKVCVLVTTDGDSSDGNLIEAMRPLQNLPVWLVVMLFTSNPEVLMFWDTVDKQLGLNIDVISDIVTEAKQVQECNPWLTYGVPVHQLRLIGAAVKELDLLDERPLSIEQMERIVKLTLPEDLFSKLSQSATEDFPTFVDAVDNYLKTHIRPIAPPSPSISPSGTPRGGILLTSNNTSTTTGSGKIPTPTSRPLRNNSSSLLVASSSSPKISSPMASPLSNNDIDMLTVWDPITATVKPWIDVTKLAESFELIRTPKSASCIIS